MVSHSSTEYVPRSYPGRAVLSGVLLLLGVLATGAGLVSHWASQQLLDTENFTGTVAPLVGEPSVADYLGEISTEAILDGVELPAAVEGLHPPVPDWLPPSLADRLADAQELVIEQIHRSVADAVDRTVASPAFAATLERSLRTGHEHAVQLLRAQDAAAPVEQQVILSIDPDALLGPIRQEAAALGLDVSRLLPAMGSEITIAQVPLPPQAATWVGIIDATSSWLPWAGLGLLVVAVALHLRRAWLSLSLMSLAMGLYVALLAATGRWMARRAGIRGFDAELVELLALRLANPLHRWLLIAAIAGAVLAVAARLLIRRGGGRRVLLRAVALGLVLAAALWLLLGGGLGGWAALLVAAGALALVMLTGMRNARPHRNTGAAGR